MEKFEEVREMINKTTGFLAKIAVILVAMILGFVSSEAYRSYSTKNTEEKMPGTKSHRETSVAINERNEIIVLDRKSGGYTIYSDSVGLMIFNHYAAKMYYKTTQK